MADILKKMIPWQSEFDHRYACWSYNHRGWAKMKRANRKLAKKQFNRAINRQLRAEFCEFRATGRKRDEL